MIDYDGMIGQLYRRVSVEGEMLTVGEMARRYGIKYDTMWARIDSGWEISKAIIPPNPRL